MARVTVEDVVKAGGKINLDRDHQGPLVSSMALRILGLLADMPSARMRRRAIEKARRMLGTR